MAYCICGTLIVDNVDVCPRCKTVIKENKGTEQDKEQDNQVRCPNCNTPGSIIMQESCETCTVCGWSKCG